MKKLLAVFILLSLGATPAPKATRLSLHTQVDYLSASLLIAQIEAAQGSSSIVLDIDTPGGSVDAGWQIVEAIEASKVPVVCVVSNGMAASMGSIILQSCSSRLMVSGVSVIMIHNMYITDASGTPDEIQALATRMKEDNDKLLNYEVRRTKVSADFIRSLIQGQKMLWIDAQQALKWGFVDAVLENPF